MLNKIANTPFGYVIENGQNNRLVQVMRMMGYGHPFNVFSGIFHTNVAIISMIRNPNDFPYKVMCLARGMVEYHLSGHIFVLYDFFATIGHKVFHFSK